MGSEKLTEGQRDVLALLNRWDMQRDGAVSGPEISRLLSHRSSGWSREKLESLEKRGFVTKLGIAFFSNARTWTITDLGRAALSPAGQGGRDE